MTMRSCVFHRRRRPSSSSSSSSSDSDDVEILGTKPGDDKRGDGDDDDDDDDDEALLTPRPSPEAEGSRGQRRPTNVVTFSDPAATAASGSSRRHRNETETTPAINNSISNEMIAAIGRRLSRQYSDKDSTTYNNVALYNHVCTISSSRGSLVSAAGNCGGERLRSIALAVIPSSTPPIKTRKPQLANMMANMWSFLFVLLQKEHGLSMRVQRDLSGAIGTLEAAHKHCVMEEEAKVPEDGDKLLRGVKLSAAKLNRDYCKDGGVKHDKECAKCGHKLVDREPEFAECKKKNAANTKQWAKEKKHLDDFASGDRHDPLLDPNTGKQITKLTNPKRIPQLVACKCWKNYSSSAFGYDMGQCPACRCACQIVYDAKDQQAIQQAVILANVSKNTTADARTEANQYLDRVHAYGKSQKEEIAANLNSICDNGALDFSSDQVNALASKASFRSSANYIAHNPPPANAHTFLQKVLTQADHPYGAGYSNVSGAHMRNHNQASAARARNTHLSGAASQSASNNGLGPYFEEATRQSLQQQQVPTGDFSEKDMREAISLSLAAASYNDASNHSLFSNNSVTSNHQQHSNMSMSCTPRGSFKTAEDDADASSPPCVQVLRKHLIELSMSGDCNNFDNATGAVQALTEKPYDPTLFKFAECIHAKLEKGEIDPTDAAINLAKVFRSLKK
eukprot:scaffold17515_cov135-Skeletonema_menzelii.AAC.2